MSLRQSVLGKQSELQIHKQNTISTVDHPLRGFTAMESVEPKYESTTKFQSPVERSKIERELSTIGGGLTIANSTSQNDMSIVNDDRKFFARSTPE